MRKNGAKSRNQKSSGRKDSSAPAEFAPNSAQSVEPMDKSTQTHSANAQKGALEKNEGGGKAKGPVHPHHSAAQHAIGSFTGASGGEREPSPRSRQS